MSIDGKKVQLGVIGAGFIAQVAHLHSFGLIDDVEIAAIAEPHEQLRETVAKRHRIPQSFADHRELLANPGIDAVVVSMPRRAQAGIVAEAIAAKRAVLSEKPTAMTLAEAQPMVASAREHGTQWAVGYMKRHDRGVQLFVSLLKDIVAKGEWGEILDVDMRDYCVTYGVPIPAHTRRASPRPTRYTEGPMRPDFVSADRARDYEYTINVAIHDINLLRLLFGDALKPASLAVRPGRVQRAVFDAGRFSIALTLGPADMGEWDQILHVTFAKGRATLLLPSPLARQESASVELTHGGRTEHIRVPMAEHIWAFEAQARSFVKSVQTGTEPLCTGEASLADLALIEGLWKTVDVLQ